ncbi:Rpn family recombination-promoting nuclease/putative transposase [Candidatus Parabeggiatoa sp. HSG14]|uniref:Rpn family recombination-promoting nuclease/putative transposase n=1 Tax=Candidatus Parabeggiatoa sp. HSG14 TaxID=3055593 RepID=UPI0025A73164|nr:Rpn family recombination-promoting nuclease/putative transposase [Thiotrichales bacterium HSG14]
MPPRKRTPKKRKQSKKEIPKKPKREIPEHDKSYKKLFSHPQMIQDLLEGFVAEPWVAQLDFSTLETVKDSFVSDNLRERHDDIICRVRWGKKWLYVYLLIEFQSTIDEFMAVRLMVYIGLLYQYLIETQKLTATDKLPPVLPLVIYNGSQRWEAAKDISELIEEVPGGLEKYRPHLRYLLIDEGSYGESQLTPLMKNLVATIIRLENTRTHDNEQEVADVIQPVLVSLIDLLKDSKWTPFRRDIVTWLLQASLPKNVPNTPIPEVVELQEMNTMLYETIQNWYKEAEVRGKAEGRVEGKAELVLNLLETKFGVLPASIRATIAHFDSETLLKCSQRLFTAKTVQEVIEPSLSKGTST